MAKKNPKRIGLAIIGAGRVGLFRGEVAARHPQVDFIGLAEIKPDRAKLVADKIGADFVTADYRELLARPEVTAAIIATDEHLHVDPILAAVERGLSLLIEKPLATELAESERVLKAIQKSGVDAVVGYTQRFRRRWLAAKEKVRTGQLGDVTLVTSRAFMNRLVALDNYKRTDDPSRDLADGDLGHARARHRHVDDGGEDVRWKSTRARSTRRSGRSARASTRPPGVITFEDGSLYHASISWALPVVWPGAVYSLDVGIVGTEGVLTIDDTHRDIVLATNISQGEGYAPDASRRVDFLGSYPPGDIALGELRGPMREETEQWLNRVCAGPADAARHRGGGAQPADADQGVRSVGEAEARDCRCRLAAEETQDESTALNLLRSCCPRRAACRALALARRDLSEPADSHDRPVRAGWRVGLRRRASFRRSLASCSGSRSSIENRAGASGNIGMEAAAQGAARRLHDLPRQHRHDRDQSGDLPERCRSTRRRTSSRSRWSRTCRAS